MRKHWVDALRALAILLVVLGHQLKDMTEYFIFTSPIKMPLFFAISGYLFNTRGGNDVEFFKNWFKKLIIPWFCLALIAAIPRLSSNQVGVSEFMLNLISGKILWFMPCFVVAEVIHFYIRKFSNNEMMIVVASLLITIIGFVLNNFDIMNFAMINRALIVQSFFLMGYLFKTHEELLTRRTWIICCSAIMYIIMCRVGISLFGNVSIDVHLNRYFNIPYCYMLICIGLFFLFSSASKTGFSNKVLSVIGKNTLIIYIWHKEIIAILVLLLGHMKIKIDDVVLYASLKTLWAVLVCLLFAHFINKYIPELVGKKR